MSYKNRSKEYDWFKGQKNQKGKDPKQAFKTTWRFTKIFLMFSLFFFSMWGCVQVFIIKTDTKVGNGVEFYNTEDEIAPHVTEIVVDKTTTPTSIYADNKNVWINEHQNNAELKAAQTVLKQEGGKKDVHKMSDAFKGLNEYFRIVDKDGNAIDGTDIVAMSSEQQTYNGLAASSDVITIFNGEVPFKVDISKLSGVAKERAKFSLGVITKLDKVLGNKLTQKATSTNDAKIQAAAIRAISGYIGLQINDVHFRGSALKDTDIKNPVLNDFYYHVTNINDQLSGIGSGNVLKKYNGSAWVNASSTEAIDASISYPSLTGTKYRPIVTWGQAWKRGVGPFYGLFVYPISQMGVAITKGMGMHNGWESLFAIVVIVFILRILAFGLTFKSVMQQTKQQELQAKKAVIDAKYESYKGNKQMEARKKQETAELYKKEGINPLGALGTIFITMPIFLSIWRVIGGVPHLKATVWLGINFSATSYKELFAGEWQYLPLLIIAALSAAMSQLYPRLLTKRRDKNRINVHQKAAMKKNNKTQNIILVVYIIMSVIFSAGIQIYWIIGGVWQVIQTTITHHILIRTKKKSKNRVKV